MHIAVVDDEPEAIRTLTEYIHDATRQLGFTADIDSFRSSGDFLATFAANDYQIVFLDIYIDIMDGMELAKRIREVSENTMIIFCTTSRENMPEAFRYHAFDYLVKPISRERVDQLMADATKVLPEINRYITFVTKGHQEVRLALSDFVWCQTHGHYLQIKSRGNEEYSLRMTMSELQALLDHDKRFLSINKGILVNMDRIRMIEKGSCVMTDGTSFPVKVREAAKIEQKWQNYIFDQLREGQK